MFDISSNAICFAAVILTLGTLVVKARKACAIERTILTDLCETRTLLAPHSTPLPILLAQRAAPNKRLIRAFKITNTFVSADVDVHASFTRSARALIAGSDWNRLGESARLAVDMCVKHHTECRVIRYDTLTQNVSLLVILVELFEVSYDEIGATDLSIVARGINDLWKLSKTKDKPTLNLLNDINDCLHRWIPSCQNPIDFIIPAFETMWRVVATTLAHTYNDPLALVAFHTFLDNPTSEAFKHFSTDIPSVDSLVTEAIRLHPPTRRITRQVSTTHRWFKFAKAPHLAVADVGAVHRDTSIWGADAHVYNPMRHRNRTDQQSQALLGFGAGTLKCVASRWAPQAAAVIVAAINERIGDELEVVNGKEIGGREGWEGWSVKRTEQ